MGEQVGSMVVITEGRRIRLTALFRAFDYDSSSAIDPQEFLAIGKAFRGEDVWTEEMNAKALARVDKDGGGSIDVNEFVEFFEKNIPADRTDDRFNNLMDRYMEAAINDVPTITSRPGLPCAR